MYAIKYANESYVSCSVFQKDWRCNSGRKKEKNQIYILKEEEKESRLEKQLENKFLKITLINWFWNYDSDLMRDLRKIETSID